MCNKDFGFLMGLVGLAGFLYATYTNYKMNRICEVLGTKIEEACEDIPIEIPESTVKNAVEKAVDCRVNVAVGEMKLELKRDVDSMLRSETRGAVEMVKHEIRPEVEKELRKQVNELDITDMRNSVITEAKEQITSKFDCELEDILAKFNRNLERVQRIYESIAEAMGNSVRQPIFKFE